MTSLRTTVAVRAIVSYENKLLLVTLRRGLLVHAGWPARTGRDPCRTVLCVRYARKPG